MDYLNKCIFVSRIIGSLKFLSINTCSFIVELSFQWTLDKFQNCSSKDSTSAIDDGSSFATVNGDGGGEDIVL